MITAKGLAFDDAAIDILFSMGSPFVVTYLISNGYIDPKRISPKSGGNALHSLCGSQSQYGKAIIPQSVEKLIAAGVDLTATYTSLPEDLGLRIE